MNKKGQIVEIGASLFMLVLIIFGSYSVLNEGEKIYVGDMDSKLVYDYSICKEETLNIPQVNQTVFKNINDAKKQGFEEAVGCI